MQCATRSFRARATGKFDAQVLSRALDEAARIENPLRDFALFL